MLGHILSTVVSLSKTKFNAQPFYIIPTECIYVFCMNGRNNSGYFPTQQSLVCFCNGDGKCLLCRSNWVFT